MKPLPIFLLLAFAALFTACEDDEDPIPPADSRWQLDAVLSDPGDGSGRFQSVDSDRTITLLSDGSYIAEGDICSFSEDGRPNTMGSYDIEGGTITPDDCVTIGGTPISLSVTADSLFIDYLCFEPCRHRYRAVAL